MDRKKLAKILMDLSHVEGGQAMQEADGTISFNGFNQKTYNEFLKRQGLPPKDVRGITLKESMDLLESEFINRNGINNIPEEYLDLVVDASFNSGPRNAAILFQRTVGADEDGVIGPKTMEKFYKYVEDKNNDFISDYSATRADFIINSESPAVQQFRDGILNRIDFVRQRESQRSAERNLLLQSTAGVTSKEPSSDVIAKE